MTLQRRLGLTGTLGVLGIAAAVAYLAYSDRGAAEAPRLGASGPTAQGAGGEPRTGYNIVRSEVPDEKVEARPSLRLAVRCADEARDVPVEMQVLDPNSRERSVRALTTPAEVALEAEDRAEILELRFTAPNYLPQRIFVSASPRSREVVLVPGAEGAQLTWSITATGGDPAPTTCRLDLYEAESSRDEFKEIQVSSFFIGLRAASALRAPILSTNVDGPLDSPGGARFRVSGMPTGGVLVVISREGRGSSASWMRLQPGESRDLGALDLTQRRWELQVRDAASKLPIAGAEIIPRSRDCSFGELARTGSDGSVIIENFVGDQALVTRVGYRPVVASYDETRTVVELQSAEMTRIRARPGSWVGTEVDGIPMCAVADASGNANVHLSERRPYVGIVDPRTWQWVRRPAGKDGILRGRCNLRLRATSAGAGIAWGYLELRGKSRMHYMASIKDGDCEIRDIKRGPYKVIVHVGTLIHDNDHSFHLDRVILKEGDKTLHVALPDEQLKLDVRRANGKPARYETVYITARGQDAQSHLRHSIGSVGITDREGRIVYSVLPKGPIRVRAGAKDHHVHTGKNWIRINLQ